MMSFLALDMQVAEASVAMHEMPIATAAKEVANRQVTAFPFLEDVRAPLVRFSSTGEPARHDPDLLYLPHAAARVRHAAHRQVLGRIGSGC